MSRSAVQVVLFVAACSLFAGCRVMPGLSWVEFGVRAEPVPAPSQVEVPSGTSPAVAVEDPDLPFEIFVADYGRSWAIFGFLVPILPIVEHSADHFELELRFPKLTDERQLVPSALQVQTEGQTYSPTRLRRYSSPIALDSPSGVQLDAPMTVTGTSAIVFRFDQIEPPVEPFAIAVDGVARVEFVPRRYKKWHLSPLF